jgi:predicted small lipoprotein YifL
MKNKMKKILSIFLIISLVFSLAACGTKTDIPDDDSANVQDTSVPTENTVVDEESDFDKYEEDDMQETTEVEKPELEYKMVAVYEKEVATKRTPYKEFCFVIEFMTTGYNAKNFKVYTDNKSQIDDIKIDGRKGYICEDNNIEHFPLTLSDDHRAQYTLVLTTENMEYSIDDLIISSDLIYKYNSSSKVFASYTPNADLQELTSEYEYAHGGVLVNLDGSYYLLDNEAGIGGTNYSTYKTQNIKLIHGKELNKLEGKVEAVKENGELIEFPKGREMHFAINENDLEIGVKDIGEDERITEEDDEIVLDCFLKYTDTKGHSTIFFIY